MKLFYILILTIMKMTKSYAICSLNKEKCRMASFIYHIEFGLVLSLIF